MEHCYRGLRSGKEGCIDGFIAIMIHSEPKIYRVIYSQLTTLKQDVGEDVYSVLNISFFTFFQKTSLSSEQCCVFLRKATEICGVFLVTHRESCLFKKRNKRHLSKPVTVIY
jgi:hypothetical protein